MRNGTYRYALEMQVPLGKRRGELELKVSNNRICGFLTMFTGRLPIESATIKGNELTFTGEMKTLISTFSYTAIGTLGSRAIELSFNTDKDMYPAVGEAIMEVSYE